MKFLVHLAHLGFLRNFESTIRALADRDHSLHIAAERLHKRTGKEGDIDGLTQLQGVTVGPGARPGPGLWSEVSPCSRQLLDYLAYQDPPLSDSPRLRERAVNLVSPDFRALTDRRVLKTRVGRFVARHALRRIAHAAPVDDSFRRFVADHAPDAVVVTPMTYSHFHQFQYVRAARSLGIPSVVLVPSWDNLTTKGFIHDLPDCVAVWNEAQRREAVVLHGVPADRVAVTGAPMFDEWFDREPSRNREELSRLLGFSAPHPFVLWLGSSRFLAPAEPEFLLEWVRRLRSSRGSVADAPVLIRPHPLNPFSDDPRALEQLRSLRDVAVWPAGGAIPVREDLRDDYFDSLYHCGAVAGLNTSALIEAAVLGKQVHTVFVPRYGGSQIGMPHFHHLLRERGGMLHVSTNFEGHFEALGRALRQPGPDAGAVAFVSHFVRPQGLDRRATDMLVHVLEAATGAHPAGIERSSLDGAVQRLVSRGAPAILPR